MKKFKSHLFVLAGFCLFMSCSEFEEATPRVTSTASDDMEWINLLNQINTEEEIILVPHGNSIQEAVDAAGPNAVIYIEPREYNETLKLSRSDIQLVSAGLSPDEKVVLENPDEVTILLPDSPQLKKAGRQLIVNRVDLGNGVAHYTFDVTMGTGPYEVVRLHRIVKENKPYKPRHAKGDVFFVHGGIQDFVDVFLEYGAEEINEETSAPYFLAANGIDVWGIDLAWNFVPLEETDFEFMKDWGFEKDMHHILKALSIARLVRGFTHQGFQKMNLLGFSNGVIAVYSAAAYETQLHPLLRNIKGLIPIDNHFKNRPGSFLDNLSCNQVDGYLDQLNAGVYQSSDALGFIYFANLALTAPDEPSATFEGLTNMQALMAITSTHTDGFHFHGGTPFEFFYTDNMRLARVAVNLGPYMPNKIFYDGYACGCSSEEVSFDDHLEEINIPLFFITAEGETPNEDYTSTLIQSTDYTRLNVEDPEKPTELDFGHGDIWASFKAQEWVWEPMRQWLLEH